jgi:hypothetical protein
VDGKNAENGLFPGVKVYSLISYFKTAGSVLINSTTLKKLGAYSGPVKRMGTYNGAPKRLGVYTGTGDSKNNLNMEMYPYH